MKILSKEKIKVLAEKYGWSLARAEGFVDGEASRRRGKMPTSYARVGIDDYCLGFRAGFFERDGKAGGTGSYEVAASRPTLSNPVDSALEAPASLARSG